MVPKDTEANLMTLSLAETVRTNYRHTSKILWVLDHQDKMNITIKGVTRIFGFPVHIKVMFMLYRSLLSVQ